MKTINDMLDMAAKLDQGKHDHVLTPQFIGRTVRVHEDLMPCAMENQATTHLCGRLAQRLIGRPPVPAGFFNNTCDPDMYAYNLNRLIGRITERGGKTDWLFRCHDTNVRAVVSDRYPTFGLDGYWENRTLLETLRRIVQRQSSHNLIRPHVDRDRLIAKVTFKDVVAGGKHWGLGAAMSNSEIGDGQFQIYGLIQCRECTNSIVIDQGWSIKHVGGVGKFHAALSELAVSLGEAGTLAAEWLNTMMYSQEIVIPDIGDAIDKVAKGFGWDEAVSIEMGVGTEGQSNVFGLVNGITWAAHRVYGEKPDLMLQMEQAASVVLDKYVRQHERNGQFRVLEFVPARVQQAA